MISCRRKRNKLDYDIYFDPQAQRFQQLDELVADLLSDKQVDELLNLVNAIAWSNSEAEMNRLMNFAPPRRYIGVGIGPPAMRFGKTSLPPALVVCKVERNSRAARAGAEMQIVIDLE